MEQEGIRLFVDDIRREPTGWHRARTVTEAIRILATQRIIECSLDHDISCRFTLYKDSDHMTALPIEHSSEETFEPVAYYVRAINLAVAGASDSRLREIVVRFHTSNPTGGQKMADILGVPYRFANYPKDYLHPVKECPYYCQPKTLCGKAHHQHPCEWCEGQQ